MGATPDLLVESLEHIGAFEIFVVLSRQPVEGQSLFRCSLRPTRRGADTFLPAQKPGCQSLRASFRVAPIIKKAPFDQTIIGPFAR